MRYKIFLLLFTMCFVAFPATAQKTVTVKSFTQTADHIPGSDRRKDLNGELCALIKVYVVDDIERIEGNKIGDVVKRGNVEKWIYMCKGSRNIRIHLRNHLPVKVMFQDYEISGLESNRDYELVIEAEDGISHTTKNNMQTFVLNYSPGNATILIDSKLYKGNGRVEVSLPIGEHNYTIAAEGYVTTEGIVKLNEHARREITENLIADNSIDITQQVDDKSNSFDSQQGYNEHVQPIASAGNTHWSPTNYTKSMIKGEGAFLYNGLYYIVISQERRTVAVVKPQKVEYKDNSYVIPTQVSKGNEVYTVTEIAPSAFERSKNLSNIVLPETIEAIGEMAFANCSKLDHFTFPSNLRYIGKWAFVFDEITEILLPDLVEEIADEAFLLCKNRAIIGHTTMGKLYVPNTIKKIGKHAFAGFKNGFGAHWTAYFDIQHLPEWITPKIAKDVGIHEDSFSNYIRKVER